MHTINKQQEFEAFFNNAAIGILVTNANGEIVSANEFALRKFGYVKEELLGQKIEILIPKRYVEKHVEHRERFDNTGGHSRPMGTGMDLYAAKKDGTEFPIEVSLSPFINESGRFVIAFVSDITVRKESEIALLQLNAELEEKVLQRTQSLLEALEKEKELNELKSRFVSMASHEFRTPLSTILSSVYLVSRYVSGDDQPKRDKHIQRIISSVNMLTDILNDFLSVGKIEEGKIQVRFSEVNICELVRNLLAEMQGVRKIGQRLAFHHTGDSEEVWLDPSLLKHIAMNLVSNAIKFSPPDGVINIDTVVNDGQLQLSVQDHGIGIPEEDQAHLFERFFRGHNVVNIQGTGLGLHIIGKYAELMNGKIEWQSRVNEGTTFTITFNTVKEEQHEEDLID